MPRFRTSRRFDVIFLLIMVTAIITASIFRVAIGDYLFFLNNHPSNETLNTAEIAGLSPQGLHLLERTNPQFLSLSDIARDCGPDRLGCLSSRDQAFILDTPTNKAQTVVTSAHEMLHLAYQRLPNDRKTEIAHLIDQAIDQNSANGIASELANQIDTADRRDEAHSLLGTEYKEIPRELETYYSEYFSDRTKILTEYAKSTH
jgi:hypothetical protein